MLLGLLLFRVGVLTDEGAAWLELVLAFPSELHALSSRLSCFRKIRAYGKPQ
jgi:hypothetical protein